MVVVPNKTVCTSDRRPIRKPVMWSRIPKESPAKRFVAPPDGEDSVPLTGEDHTLGTTLTLKRHVLEAPAII